MNKNRQSSDQIRQIFTVILMTVLLAGCAAQGPPDGGPEDKIGPELLSVYPMNGATKIQSLKTAVFNFSELVEPRSAENSLVVTPTMEIPPVVKVNRKKISVDFRESLREETTYILSFGRDIKDYRNNATENSITLAFSTGDSLDRGQITGQVFGIPDKQQAHVWAYRKGESFPDSILGSKPDYRTVADRDGHYRLNNLARGEYRLLAVASASTRISIINENDLLAVPPVDSVVISERKAVVTDINFMLGHFYLKPFRLQMVTMQNDKIEALFSRPLNDMKSTGFIPVIRGAEVKAFWLNEEDPQRMKIMAVGLEDDRKYTLTVENVYDDKGQQLAGLDSAVFVYVAASDTLAPAILSGNPSPGANNVRLDTRIFLNFSEAIDQNIPDSSFILMSIDSTIVEFSKQWQDVNTLILLPLKPLEPVLGYRLTMSCSGWRDLAGNSFSDSLSVLSFKTIDANSFGSISGKIITKAPVSGELRLNCYREKEKTPIQIPPSASGEYIVNSLLPGKYRFEIWEDRNGNGRWDQGCLKPYKAAEPYMIYPDWINVRARWETAEVNWTY